MKVPSPITCLTLLFSILTFGRWYVCDVKPSGVFLFFFCGMVIANAVGVATLAARIKELEERARKS